MQSVMILFTILVLSLAACQSHSNRPLVTTPFGKIQGYHKSSFGNKTFSVFEGIPYAKPPVGERRFEAPEPIESWTGTLEATLPRSCVEVLPFDEKFETPGDEDCLYVNVYVPRKNPNPHENLDVLVHIHGGGFMFGSGHEYAHPEYLMDHDIVFVTFNYRLGVFGFLSTEDDVVPGNNGMKDQVLVLKWIQRNIGSFGGNPRSVTLTGLSSGGGSVHLHYLSPMSKGLFQKGYSESGSSLTPFTIQRGALAKAKILGENVRCPIGNSRVLVKCLKRKPKEEILDKLQLFYEYKFYPTVLFAPVVEKGSKPFLDQEPYHLLLTKQVRNIPWLVSTVLQEGEFLADLRNNIDDLRSKWDQLAPIIFGYDFLSREVSKNVSKQIRDFYIGPNQNISQENFSNFSKIGTDRYVVDGAVKSATLQAAASNASVYYYQLSYTGDSKNVIGHGEDAQYIFYIRNLTQNELKMKDVMVDMLVSFAKNGKPAIDGPEWKVVKPDQFNFLNISGPRPEDVKLQIDENLGNGDFWNSLGL